ncbi:MAG: hypothetical protein MUF61_01010, partial [archaeon]|nr:hypothetical protein [archaeon]
MKVAWVKGNGISEWEAEIYEQIAKLGVNVVGVCSDDNSYPLNNVKLPLLQLSRFKKINWIPLVSQIIQYFGSWNSAFLGFNRKMKDFDILHTCENFNPFAYQCVKSGKPTVTTIWENIPFIHERGRYKLFKDAV